MLFKLLITEAESANFISKFFRYMKLEYQKRTVICNNKKPPQKFQKIMKKYFLKNI